MAKDKNKQIKRRNMDVVHMITHCKAGPMPDQKKQASKKLARQKVDLTKEGY